MANKTDLSLGEILVQQGIIEPNALTRALKELEKKRNHWLIHCSGSSWPRKKKSSRPGPATWPCPL